MDSEEVPLPFSVDRLINDICVQKLLPLPDAAARTSLSKIGEEFAIGVLKRISSTSTRINNFSGYIVFMVNKYGPVASSSYSSNGGAQSIRLSPHYPSSSSSTGCSSPQKSALYDSPTLREFFESSCCYKSASPVKSQYYAPTNNSDEARVQQHFSGLSCSSLKDAIPGPAYEPGVSYCVSPHVNQFLTSRSSRSNGAHGNQVDQNFYGPTRANHCGSPVQKKLPTSFGPPTPKYEISRQSRILAELEFRKLFMVHSYIGRNKLEDVVSVDDAVSIKSMKSLHMFNFEERMWSKFGSLYCQPSDRAMHFDWDSGKTHLYTCYVCSDGGYQFKGPYLDTKETHLQRAIGDENVLIVKFAEAADMMTCRNYETIAEAGILVGLKRYRFFVFKDGGKERQTKGKSDKKRGSSVKCYFIKRESIAPWDDRDTFTMNYKTTHDVRCLFMHLNMVPTMAKYNSRLSLTLSTTIKLQVDLATVLVEEIDDIPCIDGNGFIVCDEDGETLIQTDGTGFISEDLAVLVPEDFHDAKYFKDKDYKKLDLIQPETGSTGLEGRQVSVKEPPLLIQCRLYHEGSAAKGTLLVNKKLKPRTIQVRPSMIKVKKDPRLLATESFNSLEIVSVSRKPKPAKLSKNLIALLSIGGVPKEYFLDLLAKALNDVQRVCFDPRAAFRIASLYQNMDDSGICFEMFGACIPLTEPYFQYRLSQMAKLERKGLGEGKIPLTESFYLKGTTDPTGMLNNDEVCVILENGQISGKVLVYRNPGLHFGDIHVLNARYLKELEDYVGNSKFAILFSTKGRRSVANEIADGDFDGDLYFVSRNPQLLNYFKPLEPWTRIYSTPNAYGKKPSDLSSEELEEELIRLLFSPKTHSSVAGIAADSWMAFMDRYLTLQDDDDDDEKHAIKKKMLHLIDLYYDALDAPKSGKKVVIPNNLKATSYPHYMDRKPLYHSTSILGKIFDEFQNCQNEKLPIQEIWKLPQFNISIPDSCLKMWNERYRTYKQDMRNALAFNDKSKNDAASSVFTKYKQMLYGASDFKDSTRNIEHVYNEALAIYHVTYDYAKSQNDVGKCGFAWKVAGSALCAYLRKIHCMKTGDREITFLSSSFDDITIPHHQASNGQGSQEKSKKLKLKSKKGRSSDETSSTVDTSLKKTSSRASLLKVPSDKDKPAASTDNDGTKYKDKEPHKVNNNVTTSDVSVYDECTTTENFNQESVPPIFNGHHVNRNSSKSGEEPVTFEETKYEENHPTNSGQDALLEVKESENKEVSQCVNSFTPSKDSPKVRDLKTEHKLVENKYQEHKLVTSPKKEQGQLQSPKKVQDEPASLKKVQHQPRTIPDQSGSTKKVQDQLDEAQGLLESLKTTGQSKEARLARVCAGLSSRLQEYKLENAQLEELLVSERVLSKSYEAHMQKLQKELSLSKEKVSIVEPNMLEALGAKNAEIESLVSSMDTLKRQAALSEGNLASLQENMELITRNRELTETRMMQALKEELASVERRAEEEHAAHNATKMAAMEREVELEHRALDASTALAKIQRTTDERTAKAVELEQKVALLEVECSSLTQELQDMEARARRGQKKSPEDANQAIQMQAWQEEVERARQGQIDAERKLSSMEAEVQKVKVEMAAMKRDAEHYSRQEHMELEKRYRELSDLLYYKQTQLEAMTSEKAAAEFQLEKEMKRIKEAQASSLSSPPPGGDRHTGNLLQKAAKILDTGAVRAMRFLWRYPVARLFLTFYMVFVHPFMMYLLHRLQEQADMMSSRDIAESMGLDKQI